MNDKPNWTLWRTPLTAVVVTLSSKGGLFQYYLAADWEGIGVGEPGDEVAAEERIIGVVPAPSGAVRVEISVSEDAPMKGDVHWDVLGFEFPGDTLPFAWELKALEWFRAHKREEGV